jgi:hypothetical protein
MSYVSLRPSIDVTQRTLHEYFAWSTTYPAFSLVLLFVPSSKLNSIISTLYGLSFSHPARQHRLCQILPAMSTSHGRWHGSSAGRQRGESLPFHAGMRGSYSNQRPRQTVVQPPSPPLGPILTTLSGDNLGEPRDLNEHSAVINSCEDIASYNWLNEKNPTILVPGLNALSFQMIRKYKGREC